MIFEDVGFDDPTRKEEVKEDLRSKIMEVTFNKKDGEQRVMLCTLMTSAIPIEFRPKTESTKPDNPNNQSVWDIRAEGWRSFIWSKCNCPRSVDDIDTV